MEKNKRYGKRVLAKDFFVSNDTRVTGLNNNDLIVGNSGCGKTGGYVIPNMQNIDSSLLVSDTKGQLYRKFSEELQAKGYKVELIDFNNPGNSESIGYNPLDYIRRYEDGGFNEQDIMALAKIISPEETKQDPFWDYASADYIAFFIAYCLETREEKDRNMCEVANLFSIMSQKDGDLYFLDWVTKHPDSYVARKFNEIKGGMASEKTHASIMSVTKTKLELFSHREAKLLFAKDKRVELPSLGAEKKVLFLNISDTDRVYDRVINLLYTQLLQSLCHEADKGDGRLKVPVRLILDDFASGTRISDFDKIISVIRSRDIYVSIICQSLSQLNSLYGDYCGQTIMNNCDHLIYLGSQDYSTAEYVAKRAQCLPETVMCMSRQKAYIITTGEKAKCVDKIMPYSTLTELVLNEHRMDSQIDR